MHTINQSSEQTAQRHSMQQVGLKLWVENRLPGCDPDDLNRSAAA